MTWVSKSTKWCYLYFVSADCTDYSYCWCHHNSSHDKILVVVQMQFIFELTYGTLRYANATANRYLGFDYSLPAFLVLYIHLQQEECSLLLHLRNMKTNVQTETPYPTIAQDFTLPTSTPKEINVEGAAFVAKEQACEYAQDDLTFKVVFKMSNVRIDAVVKGKDPKKSQYYRQHSCVIYLGPW